MFAKIFVRRFSVVTFVFLTSALARAQYVEIPLASQPFGMATRVSDSFVIDGVPGVATVSGINFPTRARQDTLRGEAARFNVDSPENSVTHFETLAGEFTSDSPFSSAIYGMSGNGCFLVGQSGTNGGDQRAILQLNPAPNQDPDPMVALPCFGSMLRSAAFGVNNSAIIVGYAEEATGQQNAGQNAVVWLPGGNLPVVLTKFAGGCNPSAALAITNATNPRRIAGWVTLNTSGLKRAMICHHSDTQNTMIDLGAFPGDFAQSWATDLVTVSNGMGLEDWATGVSTSVGPNGAVRKGFLWHRDVWGNAVMLDIGGPASTYVEANALYVKYVRGMPKYQVGGKALFGSSVRAFLWTAGTGIVDLNTPGLVRNRDPDWFYYEVRDINSNGSRIVGYKMNTAGDMQPFLIELPTSSAPIITSAPPATCEPW